MILSRFAKTIATLINKIKAPSIAADKATRCCKNTSLYISLANSLADSFMINSRSDSGCLNIIDEDITPNKRYVKYLKKYPIFRIANV